MRKLVPDRASDPPGCWMVLKDNRWFGWLGGSLSLSQKQVLNVAIPLRFIYPSVTLRQDLLSNEAHS